MEPFGILCGITGIILVLYYYFTSIFDFWKSRGIRGPRATPVFGNANLLRDSISDIITSLYNNFKEEPMIGIFIGRKPILIVKDLDLIKDILIKDFTAFTDRGFNSHQKADPLSQNIFALEFKRWQPLRMRLSPVFTSGKLKEMFIMMSECADHLERYIEKAMSKNEPLEFCELMAKYTTDVIGICAFGIEMNALSDKNIEFRKMGKAVFSPTNFIPVILRQYSPWLFNIIYSILPYTTVTKFFTRIIVETINYKEMNNVVRNDFVDVLRELKKNSDKLGDINLTESLIAAQAFAFFVAGFETSSTTMSNALYELAINQKIQDKLREEIDEEYAKHGSNLTYENVKKMDYLDKIFKETLRMYPALPTLIRQSISSYTFNGTKISIPKDQMVWVPVYAIQRDPDIYPEPMIFDPERFCGDVEKTRHPMCYLPFGSGPRRCIGGRFAIFQIKIGLIKILRNYKVEVCEKTPIPYITEPRMLVISPKGGMYLRVRKINRT